MSRILIVEDETLIAAFLEKGLQKNGFNTAIATDGEQALQILQRDEFDLLLLDLGLPLIDGWAVLAQLHQWGNSIPVIIVTARDEMGRGEGSLGMNVKEVIRKPFRFQDLLARVRTYLN